MDLPAYRTSIRRPGIVETPTSVLWRNQKDDIAILRLKTQDGFPDDAASIATISPTGIGHRLKFRMSGWPRAGQISTAGSTLRDLVEVDGEIKVAEYLASTSGLLRLRPDEHYPSTSEGSYWMGMSGAAVLCEGHVVAVLIEQPHRDLPGYLLARPLVPEVLGRAEEVGATASEILLEARIDTLAEVLPDLSGRRSLITAAGSMVDTRNTTQQLLPGVTAFTGRTAELDEMDSLLSSMRQGSPAAAICAVCGPPGVGKTALVAHWAHRVADHFGDGSLYIDLRGYDPNQPMFPGDALAQFLKTLGVSGAQIPDDVSERAILYRTLLSDRRMLVVLDNVSSAEQARPLLPGSPSCLVVATSRDSLAGLVARDGARRLDLDLLPLHDAVALLRTLIGGRIDAEPGNSVVLAEQCARLPLALRVAAELAAFRSSIPLAVLVGELADQRTRLSLLDAGGDPRTAVRAVFSWSYRHLPDSAARAFRSLSVVPGPDFDAYCAAAVTGISLVDARQALDLLARAHLVQIARMAQFGMHDLLRMYAASLAIDEFNDDTYVSFTRLADYYLATAANAMDVLYPAESHRRPRVGPTGLAIPTMNDSSEALAWLDLERPNLVAICVHAAEHGWHAHATQMAATLFRYLDSGGHYPEALIIHTRALHAATRHNDRAAEARALTNLGSVHVQQGRYAEAAEYHERALTVCRESHDLAGAARAHNNLGVVNWRRGRYAQAAEQYQQALAAFLEIGDPVAEAHARSNLGLVYARLGPYTDAVDHLQRALALCRETKFRVGEAHALSNLGVAIWRQGRLGRAADLYEQALTIFREIDDRAGEGYALARLAVVYTQQGRVAEADDCQVQVLALFHEIGDRGGEAEVLNGIGETLLAVDQPTQAASRLLTALGLAIETGDYYEQARAHAGLARAHDVVGDHERAGHHRELSLTLFTDLGVPNAYPGPSPG